MKSPASALAAPLALPLPAHVPSEFPLKFGLQSTSTPSTVCVPVKSSMCSGKTSVNVTSPLKSEPPALNFAFKVKLTISSFCTSASSSVPIAVNETEFFAEAWRIGCWNWPATDNKIAHTESKIIETKDAFLNTPFKPASLFRFAITKFTPNH